MGYIIRIICPKCSLKKQLNLGQGMMDYKLDKIISFLSEPYALQIEQLQEEGRIKKFDFNRYLSICPACKRMDIAPLLEIILYSGAKIQYGTNCIHCGAELTIYNDNFTEEEIICPYCGDGKLEAFQVGYWE